MHQASKNCFWIAHWQVWKTATKSQGTYCCLFHRTIACCSYVLIFMFTWLIWLLLEITFNVSFECFSCYNYHWHFTSVVCCKSSHIDFSYVTDTLGQSDHILKEYIYFFYNRWYSDAIQWQSLTIKLYQWLCAFYP